MKVSPADLLDLDLKMFNATAKAVDEREERDQWTHDTELLAVLAELVHQNTSVLVRANSKKPPHIPPLRIPRPGEKPIETPVMSHRELVRFMGTGGGKRKR